MKARVPVPNVSRFEDLDELTLLACLIWGEARGETQVGKRAVAWVVRNRAVISAPSRFGGSWHGAILKPLQFSCFNASDPNSRKLLNPTHHDSAYVWGECYEAAAAVYFKLSGDPTVGADHYHTGGVAPGWSKGKTPTVVIGAHRFFRLG